MYTHYTKPPIDEPKINKKNMKKKNNNNNNKIAYGSSDSPKNFEEYKNFNDAGSNQNSSTTKSVTISDDDYINDLSEYQEEMLNNAFFQENQDFEDPSELSNTCNEILDFFQEKNLICECDYDNMIKICQDNAKWFLPIQAAYEAENEMEIIDEFLLNDEEFFIAIQKRIMDINKIQKKAPKSEFEVQSSKYLQGFPSLNETNPHIDKQLPFLKISETKNNAIVEKSSILKFGDLELNDTKNKWINQSNNELFQTFKENSRDEVKGLSLLFPNIGINYIKIAYISFGEEFEITKAFLNDYFKDSYKAGAIIKNTKLVQKEQLNAIQMKKKEAANDAYDDSLNREEIDPELRNESFNDLRMKVRKHLKLKMIFRKSERTCIGLKNYNEANKFKNLANEQDALLNKYTHASKVIFLEKLRKRNNYRDIDLHGLFLEEALEIVVDQIKYIKNKLLMGLVVDCVYKDIKGVKHLKYEIITGKGKNSQNKLPVLLPSLKKFLEKRKYEIRSVDYEGKIELYLPF